MGLFPLIMLTLGLYGALLWGVFYLVTRENRAARTVGGVVALLVCLRHIYGIYDNIRVIAQEGLHWLYVVGLLMSIMFASAFAVVVAGWLSVNPSSEEAQR